MPIAPAADRRLDAPRTGTSRLWFTKSAGHWLLACRGWSHAGGRLKMAELGGGQDIPFEQAFSNLAHAYVKDKAPKLLDYEVGFQLIEKNQENTKSVGVFGFKVGSQWLYAPVFFLNGDLKGHELLYIKSQDSFVPMKEAWINYLLGRKPSILGDGTDRNLSRLGVLAPNLAQLSRSPNKFASAGPALAGWAVDALGAMAHAATAPIDRRCVLEDYLKEAGAPAVRVLLHSCLRFPKFAEAIDRFYGPDFLERMTKAAAAAAEGPTAYGRRPQTFPGLSDAPGAVRPPRVQGPRRSEKKVKMDDLFADKPAKPVKSAGSVRVVTSDQVWARGADVIHDLSAGEKRHLMKERVVVKDTRDDDEVTIAYNVQTRLSLRNPDETGVYQVLVKPDEFKKCLVVLGPYGGRRRETFCTVVLLDGDKKKWVNTHPSNVWVRSEAGEEGYAKWWEGLPAAKPGGGGLHLILGRDGAGTCPFRVYDEESSAGEADMPLYRVGFRDYASHDRAGWLPRLDDGHAHRFELDDGHGPERIRMTGKVGARLRSSGRELWVPDGFKQLSLSKPPEPAKDGDPCCSYDGGDPETLDLGNALDLQVFLVQHTTPLRVFSDGADVKVDRGAGTGQGRMDKESAVIHLVRDVGLREKQARACVEQAGLEWARARRAAEFRLFPRGFAKEAGPGAPMGDMVSSAPNAPAFPEPNVGADNVMNSNVPAMQQSEYNVKIPDMSGQRTDRSVYDPRMPDPKSMAVAQQAAQTGQKEVFDTSALGGLLKAVRPDNMVDRYLGDMMKGMDRTGRVLFNFYWHGEEFEDRYGKQDMPELEDGLRNSFEGQGDIILKLKQKMVDADPGAGMDVDLSQVANS